MATSPGAASPHRSLLGGTVREDFDQERGTGPTSAALIAGCFRRTLDVTPSQLVADASTRAVSLQTPSLYIDLRIAADRPVLPAGCGSFEQLPTGVLAELARTTHCFAGLSTLVPASDTAGAVCSRRIAVDWQPPPRLKPNQWRIEPRWEAGGWVEWATETDRWGQATCKQAR